MMDAGIRGRQCDTHKNPVALGAPSRHLNYFILFFIFFTFWR